MGGTIDIGARIGIVGEKEFTNAMKAMDAQISANGKSMKALAEEYADADKSTKALSERQKVLQSSLSASQTKVKTLTTEYNRQEAELKRLESNLEAVRKEHGENSTEVIKAKNAYEKQATTVNNLAGRLATAEGQVAKFNRELQENATKLYEAQSKAKIYGETLENAGVQVAAFGEKISKAGTALTVGVTTPLIAAGTAAIKYASDTEESANKVRESFKEAAKQVEDFAEKTVESYGISKGQALDMAALYGDMGTSMGIPVDKAAEMSTALVGLAGDLASFKNIGLDTAQNALKGIFTGETQSLKNLGVVMTETNLQTWAMEQGLLSATKTTAEFEKQQLAVEKAQAAANKAIKEHGENSIEAREAALKLSEAEEKLNEQATVSWDSISQQEKVMLRYKYVLEQTKNAHGDYKRTADGTANSLRTMQESAKEAAAGFGQELLPVITPLINKGTQMIRTVSDLDSAQKQMIIRSAGMAAAAGPALKIVGSATSATGKLVSGTGRLLQDIGKLKAAKKGAESVGLIGSEAMKSVEGVSGLSRILMKAASPGGALVIGAVAAAGIGIAFAKARADAINADIDAHFGKIKLSAEEVVDVAKRMTATEWTMKIGAVVDAKAEIEKAKEEIETSLETINKLDWKAEIGLELSESEQDSYKDTLDNFASRCQEYVNSQGYAISLALDATTGDGSATAAGVEDFCNKYFERANKRLEDLGERLAESVNLSFEYNTFGDNLHIQNIIAQMNEVLQEIENAEYEARLDNMKLSFSASGLGIDKASFSELNKKISGEAQAAIDDSEESRVQALIGVNLQYQEMVDAGAASDFAERVREQSRKEIEESLKQRQGEIINVGFDFAFETISNNFGDQITRAKEDARGLAEQYSNSISDALMGEDGGLLAWGDEIRTRLPQVTDAAKKTISDAMKELAPSKKDLQALRDECIAAGQTVPESVRQGLEDIAEYEAMAGEVDGIFTLMAKQIAKSPEQLKAVQAAVNSGKQIPEELGKAISMYSGITYDATQGIFAEAQAGAAVSQQEMLKYLNGAGKELDEEFADALASEYGLINKNGQYMVDEAAKGLKANQGAFTSAAGNVAKAGVDAMQGTLSGTTLTPPEMAVPDWRNEVYKGIVAMQQVANANPINVKVVASGISSGITAGLQAAAGVAHAEGGIFNTPHIALVAEEAPGEAIIPLSASRRDTAIALLSETAAMIGYDPYGYAASMGRNRGERVRQSPPSQGTARKTTTYHFAEGAIQTTVNTAAQNPEAVYRVVKRNLTRDVNKAVRGKGG